MTLVLDVVEQSLILRDADRVITGRHQAQLALWGFTLDTQNREFVSFPADYLTTLDRLIPYLGRFDFRVTLSDHLARTHAAHLELRERLVAASAAGDRFKNGDLHVDGHAAFTAFTNSHLSRTLKEHQLKAALHLLSVVNGANFSVPGAGKTSVVLAVFGWLRHQGLVDAAFVVGPPACFRPWRDEYESVFGKAPTFALLAGGDSSQRQEEYRSSPEELRDLYLTSFQTLQRDCEYVRRFIANTGVRVFLVVDEAHYIKQIGGAWASAVLSLAPLATRRCVLTGTPFPRSYGDAFNLFDVLWPYSSPLTARDRIDIEGFGKAGQASDAASLLRSKIGPLFYRVRKSDLRLAPQVFHAPIVVPMQKIEKRLYDSLLDRVRELSKDDYMRDVDLMVVLRRARIMRLRQTVAYAKLLVVPHPQDPNNEGLVADDQSLVQLLRRYDELETPGKMLALASLVKSFTERGEKVLVWSNFIGSLRLISDRLSALGHGVKLIYGDTPSEKSSLSDEETREDIISAFKDPASGVDVLVANPAACAESVSLHKACAHAIYYDLSYNCAQYLQSLDRIHRVGGSEAKEAHYYFLQYEDTIDQDILSNLRQKALRMSEIIDQEYPIYGLDMFAEDEEAEAYERLFGSGP